MAHAPPLTDWVVLALVAETPRHGFSIARELAADAPLGQVWTVRRPLVYRAIDHLRQVGWIEAIRTEAGAQGPHRTVYRATRPGRFHLDDWLDRPVDHPREVRTELLAKFVLRTRQSRPISDLAARQLARFAPTAAGLEEAARDASGPDRVVARWRLESIGAVRRMLDAIIDEEVAAVR